MIFKTFQTNLDGISNKIGFSKRSFAEWSKQVSASFKESDRFSKQLKAALKTAFTIPLEKNDSWIKNKLGDIINKNNIDSFIPRLTEESRKGILENIKAISKAKISWEDYFGILKEKKSRLHS